LDQSIEENTMDRTKNLNLYGNDGKLWDEVKEKYEKKLDISLNDGQFERKMLKLFVAEENLEVDLSDFEK